MASEPADLDLLRANPIYPKGENKSTTVKNEANVWPMISSGARDAVELFRSENRYRDVAFGPDGRTIYLITDSSEPAQAIEGGATTDLWEPWLAARVEIPWLQELRKEHRFQHNIGLRTRWIRRSV